MTALSGVNGKSMLGLFLHRLFVALASKYVRLEAYIIYQ